MGPVSFVARAQRRERRSAGLVTALIVGLVGGLVMALAGGASRAASVVDRYYAPATSFDVSAYGVPLSLEQVLAMPGVRGAARSAYIGALGTRPDGQPQLVNLSATDAPPWDPMVRLLAGALPDGRALDEVAVNQELLDTMGLRVGDELPVQFFTEADYDPISGGRLVASGGNARLRITALIDSPDDLEAGSATGASIFTNPTEALVPFAFFEQHADAGDFANFGYGFDVDLVDPGGIDEFEAAFDAATAALLAADADAEVASQNDVVQYSTPRFATRRATLAAPARVQAGVLVVLAAAAGLAGSVVLALLLAADERLFANQALALSALGMRRKERSLLALRRATGAFAGGVVLAGIAAVALSGRFPLGNVRRLERDPGVQLNLAIVAIGLVGTGAVCALIALGVGARATRLDRDITPRPGSAARALSSLNAPIDLVIGGHLAFPGRGARRVVPVWQTIAAGAVAVAAVLATLEYSGAVDQLHGDRAAHAFPWDAVIGNVNFQMPDEAAAAFHADSRFARVTEARYGDATLDGTPTELLAIAEDGTGTSATIVSGRAPRTPGEIALGAKLADRLGLGIGDTVRLSVAGSELLGSGATDTPQELTVVGEALPPPVLGEADLADAALVTLEAAVAAGAAPNPQLLLVDFAPGVDRQAVVTDLERSYPLWITTDAMPAKIDSLWRGRALPMWGAVFVAFLGTVLLAYTLAMSARVMRRDLAVLRSIGMRTTGVRNSVVWQGLLIAAVIVLVGVPVGIVVGGYAWRAVAEQIGVGGDLQVSLRWLAIVPATALVAVLAAALPASGARRLRVADALRAE